MNSSLIIFLLQIPCAIFATTIHEFARAATSTILGDKKPKNDGRLTLNPIKHFEPIGFILAWTTGFGWGKPVETSQLFYKNRKQGVLITAIVPSLVNIAMAFVFSIILKATHINNIFLSYILIGLVRFNVSLAIYNIVPVTPMDGIKVLSVIMPANTYFKYIQYEKLIQMLFLLFLFLGYTDVIFNPIISFVTAAIL